METGTLKASPEKLCYIFMKRSRVNNLIAKMLGNFGKVSIPNETGSLFTSRMTKAGNKTLFRYLVRNNNQRSLGFIGILSY